MHTNFRPIIPERLQKADPSQVLAKQQSSSTILRPIAILAQPQGSCGPSSHPISSGHDSERTSTSRTPFFESHIYDDLESAASQNQLEENILPESRRKTSSFQKTLSSSSPDNSTEHASSASHPDSTTLPEDDEDYQPPVSGTSYCTRVTDNDPPQSELGDLNVHGSASKREPQPQRVQKGYSASISDIPEHLSEDSVPQAETCANYIEDDSSKISFETACGPDQNFHGQNTLANQNTSQSEKGSDNSVHDRNDGEKLNALVPDESVEPESEYPGRGYLTSRGSLDNETGRKRLSDRISRKSRSADCCTAPPSSSITILEGGERSENLLSLGSQRSSNRRKSSTQSSEGTKQGSCESDDGDINPWFRNKLSVENQFPDEDQDFVTKDDRNRRKGLVRIKRIFRSQGKSFGTEDEDESLNSFPAKRRSRPGSSSDESFFPQGSLNSRDEASQTHLEQTLFQAMSGKRRLEEVIDASYGLCTRPNDRVVNLFTKYMCSNTVIDAAFELLLEDEYSKQTGIPLKSIESTYMRPSPHRDALMQLFTSGPERLRKAILSHSKARSAILRFFTEKRPTTNTVSPSWISTATCLSNILKGILAIFPTELVDYMSARKGFLHLMVKNHIHVPDAIEFVVQLCAANALSETSGEELRYGGPNAPGIILLQKEGICDLLVDLFRKASTDSLKGSTHTLARQSQMMSIRCLLELCKRSIVLPRFNKDNCSYSSRYIRLLNSSLDHLSLYSDDSRILSLLGTSLDIALHPSSGSSHDVQYERTNPLVCVSTMIFELLETVRVASASKLAVTRRTVGSVRTNNIERAVLSKIATFCRLLHGKDAANIALRVKAAVIDVFRCLFASQLDSTRQALSKNQIPDRLMLVLREHENASILHACVLKCISTSISIPAARVLHEEWLYAFGREQGWLQVMYEHFQNVKGAPDHKSRPYFCTFVEIGFQLVAFCEDNKELKLRPLFQTRSKLETYVVSIESPLIDLKKKYKTTCGGPKPSERAESVLANAESLAARLHDFNAV